MSNKEHIPETGGGMVLVLALAGSLLAFDGSARASETAGPIEAAVTAEQEAAPELQEAPDPGVTKDARQRRKALRQARRQEFRERVERIRLEQQAAARRNAVPAGVSRPAAALTDLKVSFKLDPRLTQGLYMGERWVSPPTYSGVQAGPFTVEARVQGLDAKGSPVDISPQWIPADPEMVAVSPGQGKAVTITVRRAGQSRLRVTSHDFSRYLSIKAARQGGAIYVEISQ